MNNQLLDFVSDVRIAKSVTDAGDSFLKFAESTGACVVHAFMGTELDYHRATTLPDWEVEAECNFPDLLSAHTVKSVRAGIPQVLWGVDIDRENPLATESGKRFGEERYRLFKQRSAVTFPMPEADASYNGAGVGLGFEDKGDVFERRMSRSGGALAVASFAVHSKMQMLLAKERSQSPLSKRQVEVLQFMASGHRINSIADLLGITVATVNLHLAQVKKKLSVRTKEQALAMALTNKWIEV